MVRAWAGWAGGDPLLSPVSPGPALGASPRPCPDSFSQSSVPASLPGLPTPMPEGSLWKAHAACPWRVALRVVGGVAGAKRPCGNPSLAGVGSPVVFRPAGR